MAYSSTGLIEATDFNNFAWGGTQGVYASSPNNIAWVMGTGNAEAGYGQSVTSLNTVSVSTDVTAVQWSGLVTTLNLALGHQSGANAQVSPSPTITAGNTVTYEANVNTKVTTINTNKALSNADGTTTNGTYENTSVTPGVGAYDAVTSTFTVTFTSDNEMRYFFNAGGYLQFQMTTSGGTDTIRETEIGNLVTQTDSVNLTNLTTDMVGAGTGFTITENTGTGYRDLTTSYAILTKLVSLGTYAGDYLQVSAKIDTSSTTNGSVSKEVTFQGYLFSAADAWSGVTMTLSSRVNIVYPSTTYLSDTWGTGVVT
jgi:hypothetical protein